MAGVSGDGVRVSQLEEEAALEPHGSQAQLDKVASIPSLEKGRDSAMDRSSRRPGSVALESIPERRSVAAIEFDEFLAQVSFKRTTEIKGYSSTRIQFTFEPFKLTEIN